MLHVNEDGPFIIIGGGDLLLEAREESDGSHLDRAAWRRISRGGWIIEGTVEHEARCVLIAVEHLEDEALVELHVRVVIPGVSVRVAQAVVFAGAVGEAELVKEGVSAHVDRSLIEQCQRLLQDGRVAINAAPYVNKREVRREERLELRLVEAPALPRLIEQTTRCQ